MPRSRHRRKGRTRRTTPHTGGSRTTSQDPLLRANLPWLRRMLEVDAAEASGDAAGALALMEDMPTGPDGRAWWRPERWRRLRQLVALGDAAPAWVWGRWVVAQAAQATPGQPRRAREVAIETRGGPGTLWGVDDVDAGAKVIDHDWVYRQLVLHEHGGLRAFLRAAPGRALLDRAGGVESWVDVPMGGYQLQAEHSDRITWLDLGTGEIVETLNLGAATMLAVGEAAIGRLVRADAAVLFESAPLCVPLDVASRVASAPASWTDVLAEACRGEWGDILGELIAKMHHFDLLCDLPAGVRRQLIQPLDPGLRSDRVGTGGNGCEYDAALVLAALAGELPVREEAISSSAEVRDELRPLTALVAAALLEPGTVDAVTPMLVASDAAGLRVLADLMPSPADLVCGRLADGLAAAA